PDRAKVRAGWLQEVRQTFGRQVEAVRQPVGPRLFAQGLAALRLQKIRKQARLGLRELARAGRRRDQEAAIGESLERRVLRVIQSQHQRTEVVLHDLAKSFQTRADRWHAPTSPDHRLWQPEDA